jgi:hypothetical protein
LGGEVGGAGGGAGAGLLILLTTDFTDDTGKAIPIRVIRVIRGFIPSGGAGSHYFPIFGDRRDACPTLAADFFAMRGI